MLDHIYPFLLVHKKLQLDGIGTLEMVPGSAAIDPSGLHISAPYDKIDFLPGQVATSSSFIAWVAALDHIDIETAASTTHEAVAELAASIHLQQPVIIAGVGNLHKEGSGISFTAHEPLYAFQEALPIPTGLQWSFKKGLLFKAQPISVMDTYWWVAALLLFAAGAAAIFNYFLNINDQF